MLGDPALPDRFAGLLRATLIFSDEQGRWTAAAAILARGCIAAGHQGAAAAVVNRIAQRLDAASHLGDNRCDPGHLQNRCGAKCSAITVGLPDGDRDHLASNAPQGTLHARSGRMIARRLMGVFGAVNPKPCEFFTPCLSATGPDR